jgi:phosphatidylglycerol:prolipoprotein diacylglycerol transferase
MPYAVLQFPAFDPVLVTIGPFAIRWYALAYIVGILVGWLYARTLIRNERLWGGPAPMKVLDYDDFVLWVTLGIILGGRIGYVLFYNLPYFAGHPAEIVQVWKGGMSFHGGFIGCLLAVVLFARSRAIPVLSLGDVTCAVGPIGLFLGGGPVPRHPSQLYEATLEGVVLFVLLAIVVRLGALKRPGLVIGIFAVGYALARSFCEFFREPDPQLGFLWGGLTMGMLLSVPLLLAGLAFIGFALRRQPPRPT